MKMRIYQVLLVGIVLLLITTSVLAEEWDKDVVSRKGLPEIFTADCEKCKHENTFNTNEIDHPFHLRCSSCNSMMHYEPKEPNVAKYLKKLKKTREKWEKDIVRKRQREQEKLAKQRKRERIEKAKKLGIQSKVNTVCPACGSVIYLTRLQYLDIYEEKSGRNITCGKCHYAYDIDEGIRGYTRYQNQRNAQQAELARQYLAQQAEHQRQKELIRYQAEQNALHQPPSVTVYPQKKKYDIYNTSGERVGQMRER